jgi:hypothetical protein
VAGSSGMLGGQCRSQLADASSWLPTSAIASQAVCEAPNVGGTWTPTDCAVETQPLCQV